MPVCDFCVSDCYAGMWQNHTALCWNAHTGPIWAFQRSGGVCSAVCECVRVCPQLQQHHHRHRHHHRSSESEVKPVCVCRTAFPASLALHTHRSAEVTFLFFFLTFSRRPVRRKRHGSRCIFLFKLIAEASGPQAKIITHNSFSFVLNVMWAFLFVCVAAVVVLVCRTPSPASC